jgi:hypothetical protein
VRHSNNVFFWETETKGLRAVRATVVKVPTEPRSIQFPAVWKYWVPERFHSIVQQVISAVIVLLSHQIDDVKSINSPNKGQHELFCNHLLFNVMRDCVARSASFCRMMKFQSEPTFITSNKPSNYIFYWFREWTATPGKFPPELLANLRIHGAESNVNQEIQ